MNKNKKDEDYSYVYKNRFIIWLMWLVPIACTGWISVIAWTIVQIMMCNSKIEEQKAREENKRKMNEPFKVTPKMREINMNLTKEEKELRDKIGGRCFMKTEEGWWAYVEDKDQWV